MERSAQAIDLAGVCMADETLDAGAVVDIAGERCISEVILHKHCDALRMQALRRQLRGALAGAQAALEAGGDDALEQGAALREELGRLIEEHAPGPGTGSTMMELMMTVLEEMGGERKRRQRSPRASTRSTNA